MVYLQKEHSGIIKIGLNLFFAKIIIMIITYLK